MEHDVGRKDRTQPRPAGVAIARRRCLELLRQLDRPIRWITAPAGTGKSHLLRQAADEFCPTAILLQVEDGDADPGRFFHRLTQAARSAYPGSDPPTFGRDDLGYLPSYASRFLEALADSRASRVLIALDDMHHLKHAPDLSDALALAVGKMANRVRLLAASREAPPDCWARFMADGRMARLASDALLMDAEEIRRLLAAHPDWRHGVSDGIVADLLAATRGWPSGLGVLIELARTRPANSRLFMESEARDVVFANFSDRIFASFSPSERHRLMLIAPSPVLYPEVLQEVFGPELCLLLERLFLNNMLVAKEYPERGDAGPRYRLHALLRDFLRAKAGTGLHVAAQRDTCARMARALLALGEDDAARELLLEARDWTALAGHLEAVAEVLFASGRIRSLARFLEALPAPERDASATLPYWRGLCLLHVDPSESRRELTKAYARFKSDGEHARAIRAWGALIDTLWFEWEDCARLDPCIDDLPHLAAVAATLGDPALDAILIKGAFAALSIRRPEHPDFGTWEARNLALFQRRMPKSEAIHRGLQLMIHYVYGSGERRKAEIVRTRLQQIYESEAESAADHCVYFVVNAAYQFWFSADSTHAPATVMTGLATTERLKLPFWDVPLLNTALFRLASDENRAGLQNMLSLLDERLSADSREHDVAISHHFTAYAAWLDGDHEKALIAIDAACRIALDSGFCISPVYYRVGRTAVLASLGRHHDAWAQLSLARRAAVAQRSRTMQFMAHMVGAALALRRGREAFAVRYLRHALDLGEHEQFHAAPWLRLADRHRLCDLASRKGLAPAFAAAFRGPAPAAAGETCRAAIRTLGRTDILRQDRSELTSRRPQAVPLLLMLHLVAAGRSGRTADQLIDAMWPDADTTTGRHRLKTTLHRLRKLLGGHKAISGAGGRTRINDAAVDVDAWRVEELIAAKGDRIAAAEAVIDVYQGSFVDLYSGHPDLAIYREHLAQKVEGILLQAGKALMALQAWDRAAALLEGGLGRFGFHEGFLSLLRTCFEKAGRKDSLKRLDEMQDRQ